MQHRGSILNEYLPGVFTSYLPKALAIVNPKLPYSSYPFSDISGCTVGYKLVCALQTFSADKGISDFGHKETGYLQLACLGVIGDIVPLKNENRLIVQRRKGPHGKARMRPL